jgi:hypothetical protein
MSRTNQPTETERKSVVAEGRGLRVGVVAVVGRLGGGGTKGCGDDKNFLKLIVVMLTQLCEYPKYCWIVQFKCMRYL